MFSNPFAKKRIKSTIWYFDKELKTFVNDPQIEPDSNTIEFAVNKDKTWYYEIHEKNGVFTYCTFKKEYSDYDGTYYFYWTPCYEHGKSLFDTKEKAIEQAKRQISFDNKISEINFSDYISITDKDILNIDSNGIIYKTSKGNEFVNFKECVCNYEHLKGGSGKCVGERDLTGSNPSFVFYTSPLTTHIFFISEGEGKELNAKDNSQQRFHELQNQIISAGFTTFDLL